MSIIGPKEFSQTFNQLSKLEQDFLKILATAHESMSAKHFYKILTSANIYNRNGRTVSEKEIEQLISILKEKEWIEAPSLGEFYCIGAYEKHLVKEAAKDTRFLLFVMSIREVLPTKERSWMVKPRNFDVCVRELQIAILQKNKEAYSQWITTIGKYFPEHSTSAQSLGVLFDETFDPDWINTFPNVFQYEVLEKIIFNNLHKLKSIDGFVKYLEQHSEIDKNSTIGKQYRSLLGNAYIFQGKIKGKDAYFKNYARMAWVNFLKGNNKKAIELFEKALKSVQKISQSKRIYFHHAAGPFYILALFKRGLVSDHKTILNYCIWAQGGIFTNSYAYLSAIVYHLNNKLKKASELMATAPQSSFDHLIKAMANYWMGEELTKPELQVLAQNSQKAKDAGFQWMEMELASILSEIIPEEEKARKYEKTAKHLAQTIGVTSIINSVQVVEKWERALDALTTINSDLASASNDKSTRLIWLLDIENEIIQPKEQSLNKGGSWSKGRNAALKRLVSGEIDSMLQQDHRIAATIKTSNFGYYGSTEYSFNFKEAISKMVEHPHLFRLDNPNIPIDLNKGKPELLVDEKDQHIEFYFAYPIHEEGILIIRETPTRYLVIDILPEHERVASIIGRRLKVPKEAKEQVLEAVRNVTGLIEVQSSVFSENAAVIRKEGNPLIHVHLLPFGDGFKLEFFTKPLVSKPPYFKPGRGRTTFVTTIGEETTVIERNLEQEQQNLAAILAVCPTLQNTIESEGEYTFPDTQSCLSILLELEPLKVKDQVIIEWPRGEKIRLTHQVGLEQLSMRIQRDNDWFGVSGKLQVDQHLMMDMRHLLDLLDLHKGQEFIEVSDGQFIALTKQFRNRLGELNSLLNKTSNDMQFHPLAAIAMEEWSDQIGDLQADVSWKSHIKKLHSSKAIQLEVPTAFKATLRPYQLEGYQWLSQLAAWGVGACLADDMGLGKTIQALAVLVNRASQGPALVIAPASVASNWRKEIAKFAPSLNPIPFGPGNRKVVIHQLKPNDVLISSYGLLQQAEALLKEKQFSTIVLDEAQAIKNRTAKRSRAAMQLKGDFKIITTGTPIENHLGEFWNLFNFLNPGLLGSLRSFQERFAVPIEKNKDEHAQQALKRLIKPFILRRKKDEVLKDLPSKTEITLSVALSPDEIAFYEALRQKAVSTLASSGEENSQQRFQILAEIMRLRQACCHPKLVSPTVAIESSKLQLLGETLAELIENGHKALVFSQFVGHLKIIETYLQEQNITYQYLDGSTSLKKREKRIDAFQAGEGDVFLISLKAGGVGLNLTAADYVIHMDPWWNPAVEDQASDRAHRIGQTRPVTIYRLITENTIEEKIVKLHEHKRDLADSLLEGADSSGKLSADMLLELIKEQ